MKTYQTEDGHTKADCPQCEASEHIEILKKYGKCEICYLEEKKNTISFELTKVEKFHELKPYGRFTIKFKTRQAHLPRIIPLDELQFDSRMSMPTTDEQDKVIIKFMKKHKTDILTDGYRFYTRIGTGFGEIYHKKLGLYRDDMGFKELVDSEDLK
jgi:hypothetical protein